jgi:hypothetical protein
MSSQVRQIRAACELSCPKKLDIVERKKWGNVMVTVQKVRRFSEVSIDRKALNKRVVLKKCPMIYRE